jgi:hypothetical protein
MWGMEMWRRSRSSVGRSEKTGLARMAVLDGHYFAKGSERRLPFQDGGLPSRIVSTQDD